MEDKLFELIKQVVFKVTGKKQMTYDTDFIQDLALSSFDIMNIVCEFEDLFDVEIANRDVWHLRKVEDVIAYMREKGVSDVPEA